MQHAQEIAHASRQFDHGYVVSLRFWLREGADFVGGPTGFTLVLHISEGFSVPPPIYLGQLQHATRPRRYLTRGCPAPCQAASWLLACLTACLRSGPVTQDLRYF